MLTNNNYKKQHELRRSIHSALACRRPDLSICTVQI